MNEATFLYFKRVFLGIGYKTGGAEEYLGVQFGVKKHENAKKVTKYLLFCCKRKKVCDIIINAMLFLIVETYLIKKAPTLKLRQ